MDLVERLFQGLADALLGTRQVTCQGETYDFGAAFRRVTIEDLGSKNGTFVNGARLSGPVRLHDGDEIRLGRGVVVLRFSSALVATRTESGGASEAP
jgi:pSer/pThr/pTyr-binding forkhead associated (FHA) protein